MPRQAQGRRLGVASVNLLPNPRFCPKYTRAKTGKKEKPVRVMVLWFELSMAGWLGKQGRQAGRQASPHAGLMGTRGPVGLSGGSIGPKLPWEFGGWNHPCLRQQYYIPHKSWRAWGPPNYCNAPRWPQENGVFPIWASLSINRFSKDRRRRDLRRGARRDPGGTSQ